MKRIHAFSPVLLVVAVVGTLQAQFPFTPSSATLDVNKVRAQINSNGVLFTDFVRGQFVPVHPGLAEQPLIRSAGLWVMGRDEAGNLRGSVQVSGGIQHTDYRPGVLMDWSFNAMSGVTCKDVQAHRSDWADNGVIDNPNPNVYRWFGFGNPFLPFDKYILNNPDWWLKWQGYVDENSDGLYTPHKGDYPAPSIWDCYPVTTIPEIHYTFPYTDANGYTVSGASPIGIQIHEQVFAYKTIDGNSPLDRAIIIASRIVNRGFNILDSVYFGMHLDFDLGNPNDDFMGSATMPNMLFAYNGDNNDEGGFGADIPAVGAVLLHGPLSSENLQQVPLRHLMVLPQVSGLSEQGYYNLLQGRFPDGTPAPNGGRMYPGDPTLPGSASEIQAGNTPGERVGVASFGPFRLLPGAVNEMIVAFFYSYEPGRSPQEQASLLIQEAQEIKDAFDNCFLDVSTSCDYVLSSRAPVLRQNALTVFPSPANTDLNVRSQACALHSLSLTDALGRIVYEQRLSDTMTAEVRVATAHLPEGIYVLQANFADGSYQTQMVVVKH